MVEPTWGKAILDWVLCNEPDLFMEFKVKNPLEDSYHNMIKFTLQFERKLIQSDVSVLRLNKGNYRGMRKEQAKIDWMGTPVGMKAEQQWLEFLGAIQKVQDKNIQKMKSILKEG